MHGVHQNGAEFECGVYERTGAHSLIREQVEMGVAVRMAVLEALSRNLPQCVGAKK